MPVDIETEVVQLWAASRVVADSMKSKLPRQPDGLTIPHDPDCVQVAISSYPACHKY